MKIQCNQTPQVGERISATVSAEHVIKTGNAAGLYQGNQRIGLARAVAPSTDNPKYGQWKAHETAHAGHPKAFTAWDWVVEALFGK